MLTHGARRGLTFAAARGGLYLGRTLLNGFQHELKFKRRFSTSDQVVKDDIDLSAGTGSDDYQNPFVDLFAEEQSNMHEHSKPNASECSSQLSEKDMREFEIREHELALKRETNRLQEESIRAQARAAAASEKSSEAALKNADSATRSSYATIASVILAGFGTITVTYNAFKGLKSDSDKMAKAQRKEGALLESMERINNNLVLENFKAISDIKKLEAQRRLDDAVEKYDSAYQHVKELKGQKKDLQKELADAKASWWTLINDSRVKEIEVQLNQCERELEGAKAERSRYSHKVKEIRGEFAKIGKEIESKMLEIEKRQLVTLSPEASSDSESPQANACSISMRI